LGAFVKRIMDVNKVSEKEAFKLAKEELSKQTIGIQYFDVERPSVRFQLQLQPLPKVSIPYKKAAKELIQLPLSDFTYPNIRTKPKKAESFEWLKPKEKKLTPYEQARYEAKLKKENELLERLIYNAKVMEDRKKGIKNEQIFIKAKKEKPKVAINKGTNKIEINFDSVKLGGLVNLDKSRFDSLGEALSKEKKKYVFIEEESQNGLISLSAQEVSDISPLTPFQKGIPRTIKIPETKAIIRAEVKQRLNQIAIIKQRAEQRQAQKQLLSLIPATKSVIEPKQLLSLIPATKSVIEPKQLLSLIPATKSVIEQKQLLSLIQETKLFTEQRAIFKLALKLSPKIPPPKVPPKIPPPEKIEKKRFKLLGIKAKQKAYAAFLKRKGKWFRVSEATTKQAALDIGAAKSKLSLAATFKVAPVAEQAKQIRTGGEFARIRSTLRGYMIKQGKKIPLADTYIEKRGTRLSTQAERREIQKAKSSFFGGRLKWI
jgi:hypothetical protein